jgi:hypothetical protein
VAEIADEWVDLKEIDLDNLLAVLEQASDIPQAPQAEMDGAAAGPLQLVGRMLAGEGQQALHRPHGLGPTLGRQARRPSTGVRADHLATFHQIGGAALDDDALVCVDVRVSGGEAAGLGPDVDGDRLEALVEDAHQAGLGADPHVAAEVLRRHRVIGPLVGDVAVRCTLRGASSKHGNSDAGNGRKAGCSIWVK